MSSFVATVTLLAIVGAATWFCRVNLNVHSPPSYFEAVSCEISGGDAPVPPMVATEVVANWRWRSTNLLVLMLLLQLGHDLRLAILQDINHLGIVYEKTLQVAVISTTWVMLWVLPISAACESVAPSCHVLTR